jgi:hypothetical protein
VLAEPCGQLLREFFAERRAQQRAERVQPAAVTTETIPVGVALEMHAEAPPPAEIRSEP